MFMKHKKIFFVGALVVVLVIIVGYFFLRNRSLALIDSFEACKKAGFPIMESFPERCSTGDGRTFTNIPTYREIETVGKFTCLPHKETSGSVTLECAYGLLDENGVYYGLQNLSIEDMNISRDKKVVVRGTVEPAKDSLYAISETIDVRSVEELPN